MSRQVSNESSSHSRFTTIRIFTTSDLKYYVDTTYLNVPRPGMEVQTYMKDGMIENWELFEEVLDYTYAKVTLQSK